MRRRTLFTVAAAVLALAGCDGASYPPAYRTGSSTLGQRPALRAPARAGNLSTSAPAGSRVALLAPLTGANAARGEALAKAAQLALSAPGSPALDVLDTRSTPEGAAAAASQAISAGAAILIGPLTASETAAAARPATAAGVPMLPFTNDAAQAKPGVWPLGLTPEQQVRRMVQTLNQQGKTRLAAMLPDDSFGHAMATALNEATGEAGLSPPQIRFHTGGMQSINVVMRDISDYAGRRGPLEAQIRAATALHTPEGRKRAETLRRASAPAAPMDALLLADFGDAVHTLASLLPYYDLDPPGVRVLGPAQWAAPQVLGPGELRGSWYAAPDPALRSEFNAQFTAATGGSAPGLADFAYDAAGIARALTAAGEGYSMAALCRPGGFAGVNGVLELLPDGRVRRGLALFELRRGGPVMIEAAPNTVAAPGI